MDPEGGIFSRCVKHPSQIFTGFCSFCLAERLLIVDSAESNPSTSGGMQSEIVEVSLPDKKVRRTLLSLFELDDGNAVENWGSNNAGLLGNGCGPESRSDLGKAGPAEDESLKDKAASFRLSSMFSRRGLSWRTRSYSKKNNVQEQTFNSGFGDIQLESKVNSRHSCDWSLCRDSRKASWDVPRHSWDGSTVSRAFACSFACLDEPHDGSCRAKRTASAGPVSANDDVSVSKIGNEISYQEKPSISDVNLGSILKERHRDIHDEMSGVSTKKSHRWSKVWDWSMATPLRDLIKKRNHVLDRSMSESWREGRKEKNMEIGDQFHVNGHSSARTNQYSNRSINTANGDLHGGRLDWKKKKEFKFGRSRSVHYSSPGNFDSGLLRFYLTPLRSSRRNAGKGRTRTSRSFARGFLGFY